MGDKLTGFGKSCLPNSASGGVYPRAAMSDNPAKLIVSENVAALVTKKYGRINTSAFAREAGIGIGGVQRLLDKETSVGVELIARVAAFFNIDTWQLLAPNLGQALTLSPAELEAVRKMREPQQPKGLAHEGEGQKSELIGARHMSNPSTKSASKRRAG